MADNTHTHIERDVERRSSGSTGLAFVLGGVVVVVALLAWAFWGDLVPSDGGGTAADVSVTVEDGAEPGATGNADDSAGGAAETGEGDSATIERANEGTAAE